MFHSIYRFFTIRGIYKLLHEVQIYYGVKKGQSDQEQGFINLWLYYVPEYSRNRTTVSAFSSRVI